MKELGSKPEGLETGNAWDDLYQEDEENARTNWIVGESPTTPADSLRFMRQGNKENNTVGAKATDIAVKWFVHKPTDPPEWGKRKATSEGRSMSLLAGEGKFKLRFSKGDQECTLILDKPGDFAIWGPGLEHSWEPIQISTILTIRWKPDPVIWEQST